MLAQFQSLYPNGSLISELVDIFQGKYIVRASVQIDGVIRATGLSAAETVEAAEDQARTRALMVLGVASSPQTQAESSPKTTIPVQSSPAVNTTVDLHEPTFASKKDRNLELTSSKTEIPLPSSSIQNPAPDLFATNTLSNITSDTYTPDLSPSLPLTTSREPAFAPPADDLEIEVTHQPETPTFSGMTASNVTPFTPRSYSSSETTATSTTTSKRKKKAEPVDLSDVIAKTDVELQRLGWTPEQGREHLIKTYGKRGRTLLTEEELHSFLQYLQSQPDPIAGF
ncbi:hypothetical protein H6G76_20260 [Nostoc sp. FACHB-152]|uniref:hypothetical protein n=1 Tax=unclassified Nostoc TaxID=2593658 RepID=UPI001686643C|nr:MULTISPECIES: hypothetical protein [unclassified Nostoc]MBD2449453.1 hypothetical protein [Nostoc sp. FACHB-152]MBD2470782.1 hypothetical protein [Nostoc sp. FACHB-145]